LCLLERPVLAEGLLLTLAVYFFLALLLFIRYTQKYFLILDSSSLYKFIIHTYCTVELIRLLQSE
jgi:hypothetical protein